MERNSVYDKLTIRDVRADDALILSEIYSYYVENTAVSFEYKAPTEEEFRDRIMKITKDYPYIVCELGGDIVGYAYAGRYSERAAYDLTAASSIYVEKDHRRCGIGSAMYKVLIEKLKERGIVNLMAGTAYIDRNDEYLTDASFRFHDHMGFEKAGHFKQIGKKFDRWYDFIWMQKKIDK